MGSRHAERTLAESAGWLPISLGVYTLRIESAALAGMCLLVLKSEGAERMTGVPEMLKLVALGGIAGVLSGMFGIGGGLVIVPALVLIFGFDLKTAIGHVVICDLAADRVARRPRIP